MLEPILEPFNGSFEDPTRMRRLTRTSARTWTNAKYSGETLHRNPAEILAGQGNCFNFSIREPMMPLCRNGLTCIEGC
jgi:hypothetical protein